MPTKNEASKATDHAAAFRALRQLMEPYEASLVLKTDQPGNYVTETKSASFNGKPAMFASIAVKSNVAFHLFPVYLFPDLIDGISPELKKRMQGKTCWNFRKAEAELFEELGTVVKASFERFKHEGYL